MGKVKKKTRMVSRPDIVVDKSVDKVQKLEEIDPEITIGKAKEPAANSLTKRRINKLFRMFCDNVFSYISESPDIQVTDCSGCLLREIPWKTKSGQVEDLCYAIWHEGILND